MISIIQDVFSPDNQRLVPFEGPLIDFLQKEFPHGFGAARSAVFVNRNLLPVEHYDRAIGEQDTVVIMPCIPEGLETFWIPLLINAIAAAVVAIATYFLTKPPAQRDQNAARRVYEIGSGQNVPALGQVIAEHYGKLWFYPDVASQPYVQFVDNEQYVNQILLLGAGKYQLNGIKIGNTELSMIPAGLVEYSLWLPEDHQSQYGVIQAATGVYEDVITSVDVVDLDFTRNANSSFSGKAYADDNYIKGAENVSGFKVGDSVMLLAQVSNTNNANHRHTTTVTAISGNRMYLQALLNDAGNPRYQVVKDDSGWRGWFSVCPVGKKVNKIEFDFNWPQGISIADDEGNPRSMSVWLNIEIQQIDDNNVDIGLPLKYQYYANAATRDPIRRTVPYAVPEGRYKVRVQRDNADDLVQSSSSRGFWYGLKGYAVNALNQFAYGNVTLLVMKMRASEALSSSSDKVLVQATRILPTISSDFTLEEPTVNPVDAFSDVVRQSDPNGLDVPELKVLATRWAGTNGFNFRFQDQDTVYNALQIIAAGHRAFPTAYAKLLSMRVDEKKPVDQFVVSQEHMAKDSYKVTISVGSTVGLIDGYRVKYRDPTSPTDLYIVFPSGALAPTDVNLDGCTDQATAVAYGQYLWAKFLVLKRVLNFTTELDALAYSIGDRILVVNNVIDNVRTARVLAVNGLVLTMDAMLDAQGLSVIIRDQYGSPSGKIEASMVGNQLTLSELPDFPIFGINSGQENTSVVIGSSISYSRSYLIQSLSPNGTEVEVEAVTYSDEPYLYPIPGEVIAP